MTRQSYRHCLLRRLTSTFNGRGASRRCTLRRRARSRACCWRAGRMRRRRRTMATHPPSRLQVVQQSRFSLESIGRSPAAALDLVRERAERPQADERRGTFAEAAGHPTRRCISTRQLVRGTRELLLLLVTSRRPQSLLVLSSSEETTQTEIALLLGSLGCDQSVQ